jgi:predicted ATP-grasp superfamily ATP-dependent carboligase
MYTKPYYLYPDEKDDGFVDAIIKIIKKEKPDVLLPMAWNTKLISRHRMEIEKYCKLLVPDYESFIVAYDSKKTLDECKKIDISCPKILTEKEAIMELNKNMDRNDSVKVVIKPRKEVGGSQGVSIVKDPTSLKRAIDKTEKIYGETVIEEYIPGDTKNMRTLNLIFDKKGKLAAYFTTKKLRQWPITGGISALSVSTNEWNLVEMVLPFFKKWQWEGPAEVEIKIDSRDNKPKLIEINPRFWGNIGIPIKCGVNFPMIACKLAQGENVQNKEYPQYPVGIKYINPTAYLKVIMSNIIYSKNKMQVITSVLTDLKGKKVSNNIELRDFKPIIGKILLELKSIIK